MIIFSFAPLIFLIVIIIQSVAFNNNNNNNNNNDDDDISLSKFHFAMLTGHAMHPVLHFNIVYSCFHCPTE